MELQCKFANHHDRDGPIPSFVQACSLHNQLALFDRLRKAPNDVFTQQGHSRFHGVSQVTARKDLEALVALGLLQRQVGRPILYRATARFAAAAKGYQRG